MGTLEGTKGRKILKTAVQFGKIIADSSSLFWGEGGSVDSPKTSRCGARAIHLLDMG